MTDRAWKGFVAFIIVASLLTVRYVRNHENTLVPTTRGDRGLVPPDPRAGLYVDSSPKAVQPDRPQPHVSTQPPPKIVSATEITCKQSTLKNCNAAARKLAEGWENEDSRDEAERWFTYTCEKGSKDGCRSLLVLAKTYASTHVGAPDKDRQLLFRTCEIGDPRACADALARAVDTATQGSSAPEAVERAVFDAYQFLGKVCHASYPDPDGAICKGERARFAQLLSRGIKGLERAKAKTILKEMADDEKRGSFITPNEQRREWVDR